MKDPLRGSKESGILGGEKCLTILHCGVLTPETFEFMSLTQRKVLDLPTAGRGVVTSMARSWPRQRRWQLNNNGFRGEGTNVQRLVFYISMDPRFL